LRSKLEKNSEFLCPRGSKTHTEKAFQREFLIRVLRARASVFSLSENPMSAAIKTFEKIFNKFNFSQFRFSTTERL